MSTDTTPQTTDEAASAPLDEIRSQHGDTLRELSERSAVLVVLLRHSGCTFCRRALGDIARSRHLIESAGTSIALVHMADEPSMAALCKRYGVDDLPRFADPDRRLYEAFEVPRGSVWQVMGPQMWGSAVRSILGGHLPGVPKGDLRQMPGAVLFSKGRVFKRYDHAGSGDRPDYVDLAGCTGDVGECEV